MKLVVESKEGERSSVGVLSPKLLIKANKFGPFGDIHDANICLIFLQYKALGSFSAFSPLESRDDTL